jgi:hypothetical protein
MANEATVDPARTAPLYTITIDGPGGVINNVLAVVQDALERSGFAVEVVNSHPHFGTLGERL